MVSYLHISNRGDHIEEEGVTTQQTTQRMQPSMLNAKPSHGKGVVD